MVASTASKEAPRALILVVERDPHVNELERYFLEQAGFTVEMAEDGETALAQVKRLMPAVLITELLVPGVDGLTLCRQIKDDQETSGVRILAFSFLAARERALEAGADAFLLKPLLENQLIDAVQHLMNSAEEEVMEA